MTAAQASDTYAADVRRGWWQGEYVLEPVVWHSSANSTVGEFSGWTAAGFADAYKVQFGAQVRYVGASAFASCVALAQAIETAGTLHTNAVADALRRTNVTEFYHVGEGGRMQFDEHGQALAEMIVTQMKPGAQAEDIVYQSKAWNASWDPSERGDQDAVRLLFPMPTWAYRRCIRESATRPNNSDARFACSGSGECQLDGTCTCINGWHGALCDQSYKEQAVHLMTVLIITGSALVAALGASIWLRRRLRPPHKVFRELSTKEMPSLVLGGTHRYHMLVIHVWSTGQDRTRIGARSATLLPPVPPPLLLLGVAPAQCSYCLHPHDEHRGCRHHAAASDPAAWR